MIENFQIGLNLVLKWEGGYTNDPDDPGGATKWGIAWNRIGRQLGLREKDMVGLTVEEAKNVYRVHYWNACQCDQLPTGFDIAVFDSAVNQGPARARRLLQQTLGVKVDGVIGSVTLRAALARRGDESALADFMVYRVLHYTGLLKFGKYGKGWLRRVFDCYRTALKVL